MNDRTQNKDFHNDQQSWFCHGVSLSFGSAPLFWLISKFLYLNRARTMKKWIDASSFTLIFSLSVYVCVQCVCVCVWVSVRSDADWKVSIDPNGRGLIHTQLYLCFEDVSSVIWRHYSPETNSHKSLLPLHQYTINDSLNTHTHILYVRAHMHTLKSEEYTPTNKTLFLYLLFFPPTSFSLLPHSSHPLFQAVSTDLLKQKAHIMSSHQPAVLSNEP